MEAWSSLSWCQIYQDFPLLCDFKNTLQEQKEMALWSDTEGEAQEPAQAGVSSWTKDPWPIRKDTKC